MDVYRFINSRDVAEHLKCIGYEFTMPEAAFLVYWSRHATLEEKRAAWLELADTMPDCGMPGRRYTHPIPSFRRFLLDFAKLKEREVALFFETGGCVYSDDCGGISYGEALFDSAASCIDYLRSILDDDFDSLTIAKRPLNKPGQAFVSEPFAGRLQLDHAFRITDVDVYDKDHPDPELSLQFREMWFAFPTPFRRGDIVRDTADTNARPLVLESLCTWSRDDYLANGFREGERAVEMADKLLSLHAMEGDFTDLSWSGYGMDGGELWLDDPGPDHLSIERVTGELAPEDQWAEVVSAYLRGGLRFEEAVNLLRHLPSRSKYEMRLEIAESDYSEKFYSDSV